MITFEYSCITSFCPRSFGLLKRFLQFLQFLQFWPTLSPKSGYKNVEILAYNGHFYMDWSLKFHLSYSLQRNLKVHFLALSSHFEKFWIIVLLCKLIWRKKMFNLPKQAKGWFAGSFCLELSSNASPSSKSSFSSSKSEGVSFKKQSKRLLLVRSSFSSSGSANWRLIFSRWERLLFRCSSSQATIRKQIDGY